MKVGFTGTRQGMTAEQRHACVELLAALQPSELHHGDAIGADAEMHALALGAGLPIVVHPPVKATQRAFCEAAIVRTEATYMKRNRAIVDETELLIAVPRRAEADAPRSGTWKTVRVARAHGRPVVVVWPDGTVDRMET